MKVTSTLRWLSTIYGVMLMSGMAIGQQVQVGPVVPEEMQLESFSRPTDLGFSTSAFSTEERVSVTTNAGLVVASPSSKVEWESPRKLGAFSEVGVDAHVAIDGIGFDVATPLAQRFNARIGADFFNYSDTFVEQGANVNASLQLRSGHLALDWFPFANGFHVSPMMNFANNNKVRATALIPSGSTVTLSGTDYISSLTDPLHGSGSVGFRKTSIGLTMGYGNIIPRSGKHFSFPVELGFYYVGQPTLKVAFTGSACDPNQPPAVGCQSVDSDQDFQQSLSQFYARNNNNLSYASFFPVFSVGLGYRF